MRVFIAGLLAFAVCAPLARGQDSIPLDRAVKEGKVEAATPAPRVIPDAPGEAQSQPKAIGGGWARVPGIVGKAQDGAVGGQAPRVVNGSPASDGQPVPESSGSSPAGHPDRELELARRVAALENQVAKLRQSNSELVDIANNHSHMLGQIAASRTTPDGARYYVPNVTAISDDPKSRQALVDTVVQDITRRTGTLEIHNDMESGQSLVINGVETVYVAGHSIRNVNVPSGTATTELVGAGEGTRSWAIGAPNYVQVVIIAPAISRPAAVVGPWQYDPLSGVWWRTLR